MTVNASPGAWQIPRYIEARGSRLFMDGIDLVDLAERPRHAALCLFRRPHHRDRAPDPRRLPAPPSQGARLLCQQGALGDQGPQADRGRGAGHRGQFRRRALPRQARGLRAGPHHPERRRQIRGGAPRRPLAAHQGDQCRQPLRAPAHHRRGARPRPTRADRAPRGAGDRQPHLARQPDRLRGHEIRHKAKRAGGSGRDDPRRPRCGRHRGRPCPYRLADHRCRTLSRGGRSAGWSLPRDPAPARP